MKDKKAKARAKQTNQEKKKAEEKARAQTIPRYSETSHLKSVEKRCDHIQASTEVLQSQSDELGPTDRE